MKKFIITEEDRKHIKGLYEQADSNAQAYNDLAGKELIKLYPNKEYLTQTADVISKRLDNETRTDNYIASSGEEVVGAGMNPNLLPYIKQLIQTNSGGKIKFSNTPTVSTPAATTTTSAVPTTPAGGVSQQPIAGEKINTTNDRSYDYKLANGKYYYSKKGLNKWVEAKGTGLNNIKTKVKF